VSMGRDSNLLIGVSNELSPPRPLSPGGRPTGRRPRTGIADDSGGAAITASPALAAGHRHAARGRLRDGAHGTAGRATPLATRRLQLTLRSPCHGPPAACPRVVGRPWRRSSVRDGRLAERARRGGGTALCRPAAPGSRDPAAIRLASRAGEVLGRHAHAPMSVNETGDDDDDDGAARAGGVGQSRRRRAGCAVASPLFCPPRLLFFCGALARSRPCHETRESPQCGLPHSLHPRPLRLDDDARSKDTHIFIAFMRARRGSMVGVD